MLCPEFSSLQFYYRMYLMLYVQKWYIFITYCNNVIFYLWHIQHARCYRKHGHLHLLMAFYPILLITYSFKIHFIRLIISRRYWLL